MYALVEKGSTDSFRRKYIKIFCDIDALAVSMSQKFLRACREACYCFFFKKARTPLQGAVPLLRISGFPLIVGIPGNENITRLATVTLGDKAKLFHTVNKIRGTIEANLKTTLNSVGCNLLKLN